MTTKEHDLVVIGAGPGGYVAAIRAAQLGMNVACIEKEPALGGTCLRIGCIPSKAMLESSERFWAAKHELATHGVKAANVSLDLATMLRRKEQVVTTLTRGVDVLFRKNKITRYSGHGKLNGLHLVKIEGSNEDIELKARSIIIATGSKPATIAGVKSDSDRIATSTEALSYSTVPQHLVVIGAGYIGLELGSVWSRLGAKVTVLEFLDRILFGMDAEIASEARKLFEKQGIEFRLGSKVTGARFRDGQCTVEYEGGKPIICDRVLVAVGRVPNTEGLGLEHIKIELHKKGYIPVNERFETSVEGIRSEERR